MEPWRQEVRNYMKMAQTQGPLSPPFPSTSPKYSNKSGFYVMFQSSGTADDLHSDADESQTHN